MPHTTLVWFRQDLRLHDHPALSEAACKGFVVPVYILDDLTPGVWRWGGASRWWLHHALDALQHDLAHYGLPLILKRGDTKILLPLLAHEHGAHSVFWNAGLEPFSIKLEYELDKIFATKNIETRKFQSSLLYNVQAIQNKQGKPFKIFTSFWNHCRLHEHVPQPLGIPPLAPFQRAFSTDRLEDWSLMPQGNHWSHKFSKFWTPGEKGAQQKFETFVTQSLSTYATQRDQPYGNKTSRLSPHLHWGEISPRHMWNTLFNEIQHMAHTPSVQKFLTELGWRDFSYALLYHVPHMVDQPLRPEFAYFPWHNDAILLRAWQQGQTGYPLIDAGMRELWTTGYMHNRVRMIAASFLVKDLLISWQKGAAWFWDTLLDADLANNSASWQWVAGCGVDAAPYFRIFNPVLQSRTFDPDGYYIKQWVPELAHLSPDDIHAPWRVEQSLLTRAGVDLGHSYPWPIIDHDEARRRALNIWRTLSTHTSP